MTSGFLSFCEKNAIVCHCKTLTQINSCSSIYLLLKKRRNAFEKKLKQVAFEKLPFFLDKFEAQVKKNDGYLVGGKVNNFRTSHMRDVILLFLPFQEYKNALSLSVKVYLLSLFHFQFSTRNLYQYKLYLIYQISSI